MTDLEAPTAPPAPRRSRLPLILSLAIGIPLLVSGGVVAALLIVAALTPKEPPRLDAQLSARIADEVTERRAFLDELAAQNEFYKARVDDWTTALGWAADFRTSSTPPTPSVPNPGGDAMPGDDPYGRAFLDSIGATDVTVVFEAGAENCGYAGEQQAGFVYAGGCFNGQYANTLFMAWDPGAEDMVWSIFVHEAMHWYQDETYIQDVYLADFAGVGDYSERWEADASCRAVYTYGLSIDDYADSSSPCTIDGWYEGYISDYLASLGAKLGEPDPAEFELVESSRP